MGNEDYEVNTTNSTVKTDELKEPEKGFVERIKIAIKRKFEGVRRGPGGGAVRG